MVTWVPPDVDTTLGCTDSSPNAPAGVVVPPAPDESLVGTLGAGEGPAVGLVPDDGVVDPGLPVPLLVPDDGASLHVPPRPRPR